MDCRHALYANVVCHPNLDKMNHIEKIRTEVTTYIDLNSKIGDDEIDFSLTRKYRIERTVHKQTKPQTNYDVTKVHVFDNETEENLFSFFVNWDQLFYSWIIKDNVDYLICAEDIYGGQTIIDLTNRKMESYSPGEDGFIGTDYYLSPNSNILGIAGCYWACPYVLKLYHFDDPMQLPLTEFYEIDLTENLRDTISWVDNEALLFKNETNGQERVVKIGKAHNNSYNTYDLM